MMPGDKNRKDFYRQIYGGDPVPVRAYRIGKIALIAGALILIAWVLS